ncbi:MAG: hotdog domain-containing protein [Sporichthyaceae bacterium]
MTIERGLEADLTRRVTPDDCADALGSGDLPVLATPRLLAWCEAATVAAVAARLDPGQTSVGTRIQLEHTRASAVGAQLSVRAHLVHVDGRLLRFEVVAEDGDAMVGHGEVTRVVVDRDRFLSRL